MNTDTGTQASWSQLESCTPVGLPSLYLLDVLREPPRLLVFPCKLSLLAPKPCLGCLPQEGNKGFVEMVETAAISLGLQGVAEALETR